MSEVLLGGSIQGAAFDPGLKTSSCFYHNRLNIRLPSNPGLNSGFNFVITVSPAERGREKEREKEREEGKERERGSSAYTCVPI